MKALIIFFVLFLSSLSILSQEAVPSVELFFITEGVPASPIMTFTLNKQAQVWGWSQLGPACEYPYGNYYLTNDYDNQTYIPLQNNWGTNSRGFDFVTSTGGSGGDPDFAYGIYKVTSNGTNKYFYLDYRDYRAGYYGCYNPPSIGNDIDIRIKYRYDIDAYSYSPTSTNFINISNGQLLNIWDMKGKGSGTQLTSRFPNYWENSLTIINGGDDHPKLVWGPYPTEGTSFNVTGYKIYRAIETSSNPETATFYYLASVSATQHSYVDEQYSIGRGWYGFYKISAVDETVESDFSNAAMTGIDAFGKDHNFDNVYNDVLDYSLSQNYPNPFNPNTMIVYSVKEDGIVVLKIYDILGHDVATLVNEKKFAGKHFIEFDSSDLSSGIYIYKLISGNFIGTRKMIIIK